MTPLPRPRIHFICILPSSPPLAVALLLRHATSATKTAAPSVISRHLSPLHRHHAPAGGSRTGGRTTDPFLHQATSSSSRPPHLTTTTTTVVSYHKQKGRPAGTSAAQEVRGVRRVLPPPVAPPLRLACSRLQETAARQPGLACTPQQTAQVAWPPPPRLSLSFRFPATTSGAGCPAGFIPPGPCNHPRAPPGGFCLFSFQLGGRAARGPARSARKR